MWKSKIYLLKRIIILFSLAAGSITACNLTNEVTSYKELLACLNKPENGFNQVWSNQDDSIVCAYKPPLFLAAQDIVIREIGNPTQLDSLTSAYKNQSYFTLTLSHKNQEFENQFLYNRALYIQVVEYMNSEISQKIFLRTPDKGLVKALAVSYPRMFGATNNSTLLITFNYKLPNSGKLDFYFEGRKLGLPPITFHFDISELNNIPSLTL